MSMHLNRFLGRHQAQSASVSGVYRGEIGEDDSVTAVQSQIERVCQAG